MALLPLAGILTACPALVTDDYEFGAAPTGGANAGGAGTGGAPPNGGNGAPSGGASGSGGIDTGAGGDASGSGGNAPDDLAGCEETVVLGDTTYWFCLADLVEYQEARSTCQKNGAHLATITSKEENDLLASVVDDHEARSPWVDGTDQAEEGTWRFRTGQIFYQDGSPIPTVYSNFAADQPTEVDYENCLAIQANGDWYDFACDGDHGFVCESNR